MTKLVFMGTPAFSVPILEGLIESGYEIQAVVTQPDRPVGRKRVITPTPVKEAALKHGIRVLQPEKISGSPEMEEIIELAPDVIVTAAFGQFLPEKLLQVPKLGAINVHASLLPKYRGGAPVHYAIMNGEKETGVTIMEMIKKMDAGGIYAQESMPITSQKPLFRQTSHVNKKRSIGIKLQKKSTTKYAGCVLGRLHSRPMKVHAGNYYRLKYWQKVQTKHQARSSEKTKKIYGLLAVNRPY
jgi:methionyl-tRNA formyltransferase